ncbi:olfactory receptor 5M5-like [Pelobates fuscus]|uniref:olfactory receptor 5M5-like n=1 Tax=Pelobates fuscus TaxID=191477 RepID=UPI002FE49E8F
MGHVQIGKTVTEFILLGLSDHPKTQCILFVFLLIAYVMILFGNFSIIFLCLTDNNLKTPMYVFLSSLSLLDICFATSTVPRMLKDLLSVKKTISFEECAVQMFVSLSLGVCECILLAVMAYDRYIAICNPLRYTSIISRSVCIRIILGNWIFGFVQSIPVVLFTLNVDVCGHNTINHFVCEVPEVLSLACANLFIIECFLFFAGSFILMIPVAFIVISYIKIIITILNIASSAGRQKAFSTCGSHMMVVTLFYGTIIAAYMKPRSISSPETDKIIAVFYIIVTPILNPLIYTLRNKDIKVAIFKCKSQYF